MLLWMTRLRGRPDFPPNAAGMNEFAGGIGAALVARFVRLSAVPSYCALAAPAKSLCNCSSGAI